MVFLAFVLLASATLSANAMSIQPEARSNLTDIAFINPDTFQPFWKPSRVQVARFLLVRTGSSVLERHTQVDHRSGATPSSKPTPTHKTTSALQTSARIETQRGFGAASRGKLLIEARIKLGTTPAYQQQGIWNAFWAIGKDFRGNYWNWPAATEWDILEVINGDSIMYSTAHCGTRPGGPCKEDNGIGGPGANFSRGYFHTVRLLVDRTVRNVAGQVNWQTESMTWSLDGKDVFVHTGERVGDSAAWEKLAYDEHFLLLNIAIGGNWPGAPNAQTVDGPSVAMEVDYVGVWNSV